MPEQACFATSLEKMCRLASIRKKYMRAETLSLLPLNCV